MIGDCTLNSAAQKQAGKRRTTKAAQIVRRISDAIAKGDLIAGDRLPSEERLALRHKVSLGTIQKALGELAHVGILRREHGRGTFVSATALEPTELRFLRFRGRNGEDLPV